MSNISSIIQILKEELDTLKELLMAVDCGEMAPESLPLPMKFYVQKRERIENLLWIMEVEKRTLAKKSDAPETYNT